MRVESLEAYNISDDILAIWREKVGEHLLPVQEKAVKEFGRRLPIAAGAIPQLVDSGN